MLKTKAGLVMFLANQIQQVRLGGWPIVKRKLFTSLRLATQACSILVNGSWSIPAVVVIRLLWPFKKIRLGVFYYSRIGHFAADVGQRKARELVAEVDDYLDLYYLPDDKECSNSYWAMLVRRWFHVHSFVKYLYYWNQIIPFGSNHVLRSSDSDSRDVEGYLARAHLQFPILKEEERAAWDWMGQFGWKPSDPFVCLLVRDDVYLKYKFGQGYDYSYHSYRDSEINTYIDAINYLNSEGVFVFRMGRKVSKPLAISHPKFIDYAFSDVSSDFVDVWLFANCSLCITTGSGPDTISDVFRRPILSLNILPLHGMWSWSNAINVPKILKWTNSGKLLSLSEYLDNDHFRTNNYLENGIDIVDLSSNQILQAVREAWDRINDRITDSPHQKKTQQQVWDIVLNHEKARRYHGFRHPDARIGMDFLRFAGSEFVK